MGVRKSLISKPLFSSYQATNQGVVGSNPASRTSTRVSVYLHTEPFFWGRRLGDVEPGAPGSAYAAWACDTR
jgi:hypothetical protein